MTTTKLHPYQQAALAAIEGSTTTFEKGNNTVKHTPGPWLVSDHAMSAVFAGKRLVASCAGFSSSGHQQAVQDENDANACLIAAAPELLELLSGFVELIPKPQLVSMGFDSPPEPATEYDHQLGYQLFLARAAIAKATGREMAA